MQIKPEYHDVQLWRDFLFRDSYSKSLIQLLKRTILLSRLSHLLRATLYLRNAHAHLYVMNRVKEESGRSFIGLRQGDQA